MDQPLTGRAASRRHTTDRATPSASHCPAGSPVESPPCPGAALLGEVDQPAPKGWSAPRSNRRLPAGYPHQAGAGCPNVCRRSSSESAPGCPARGSACPLPDSRAAHCAGVRRFRGAFRPAQKFFPFISIICVTPAVARRAPGGTSVGPFLYTLACILDEGIVPAAPAAIHDSKERKPMTSFPSPPSRS